MDNYLINICQLLLPLLMNTKYNELVLTHNSSVIILPSERYKQIYKKGAYLIPPVIALYDGTINKDATRTEVRQVEGKHEAEINDCQIYETANNACWSFIMAVVDTTWYKELMEPDIFYTNVTALKVLDHLTEFFSGLHTANAVDIPQVMKTLFSNAEGIPQLITAMEAAQRKSKRAKLVINEDCIHAVALKLWLQYGEYKTETREWSKLPDDKQTWSEWKTTFRAAYVTKQRA